MLTALNCLERHHYGLGDFPPDNANRVTITQGIWGDVWFWEGDFMLGSGTGTITPVVRTVYAYELTDWSQVDATPSPEFFSAIHSRLVDSTESDAAGFFQMTLAPGRYSIFVREDSAYFANGDDGQYIFPETVVVDSVTRVRIDIDYKAFG